MADQRITDEELDVLLRRWQAGPFARGDEGSRTDVLRLIAEIRRLRKGDWIAAACAEIADDPSCGDVDTADPGAMEGILHAHLRGTASGGWHAGPQKALAGVRVVAVDDDPDTLEAVCWVLERAGAVVSGYSDAVAALGHLRQQAFDLLVSDIAMPNFDGFWLIEEVRRLPRNSQLPAIALSAHATSGDVEEARDAGYQGHLAKPTDPETLVSTVVALLAKTRG